MWPFNVFVKSKDVLYKYQPKSDFMFTTIDGAIGMPLIVGEVISDNEQSDKWRMLCQAIAIARLLAYFKTVSKTALVVMAVYIDNNFHADRYLLYVTKATKSCSKPVSLLAEFATGY